MSFKQYKVKIFNDIRYYKNKGYFFENIKERNFANIANISKLKTFIFISNEEHFQAIIIILIVIFNRGHSSKYTIDIEQSVYTTQ